MQLPEIKHLYNALVDCILNDSVTITEIHECLLNAINEQEVYYAEQLQRVQTIKKLITNSVNPSSDYHEKMSNQKTVPNY